MAAWNSDPLAKKVTYTVGGFGIAVGLFEVQNTCVVGWWDGGSRVFSGPCVDLGCPGGLWTHMLHHQKQERDPSVKTMCHFLVVRVRCTVYL